MNIRQRTYLINFIVGGLTVVGIGLAVENYSTKIGSIIWSIPYTLLPVIVMMWYLGYSNKEIGALGLESSFAVVLAYIFLHAFYRSMIYFDKNDYGIFYSTLMALLIWSIPAYLAAIYL